VKAEDKTKEQIIKGPRQRIDELEKSETLRKRAEIAQQGKKNGKRKLETCKSHRIKIFRIWFTNYERTRLNWKCRTKNFSGHKMNLKSRAVSVLTCTTLPRLVILLWFKVTAFLRVIKS
jgi:hypothetical protein